jgi:flagellar biosynthesis protein FlhF
MTMSTAQKHLTEELQIHTFRAASMPEALREVRRTLGPDAAVLQTREVRRGLLQWLTGSRQIEVVASTEIQVPSRFPALSRPAPTTSGAPEGRPWQPGPGLPEPVVDLAPAHAIDYRRQLRESLSNGPAEPHSLVEDLCRAAVRRPRPAVPQLLQPVYQELLQAEVDEALAWDLVDPVRQTAAPHDLFDAVLLKSRVARLIERQLRVAGPLPVRSGQTRVVALVGPTGVGKTTTIAKLAAHFRLREQRRVGLITLDSHRLAAPEQLRMYAELLDVPLEVAATPEGTRAAVQRLAASHELVLLDTAGHSPHDAGAMQQLKCALTAAGADEVQLVLSAVASAACLRNTASQFAAVGVTALLLTKLDEATGLGRLLSLAQNARWPFSYITRGQQVPQDLELADPRRLTRWLLGVEACARTSDFS